MRQQQVWAKCNCRAAEDVLWCLWPPVLRSLWSSWVSLSVSDVGLLSERSRRTTARTLLYLLLVHPEMNNQLLRQQLLHLSNKRVHMMNTAKVKRWEPCRNRESIHHVAVQYVHITYVTRRLYRCQLYGSNHLQTLALKGSRAGVGFTVE